MIDVVAAFSLPQASKLTGVPEARLVDWDRECFFIPSLAYEDRRSPYSRVYSFEDLVGLRTLNILRDRVSMQHLKKAALRLKQHSGKPWSDLTLYTLNDEVHFKNPKDGKIEGVISGQYGATIPLESIAEELREEANKLRERDRDRVGTIERHKFTMSNAPVFGGTRITVASVVSYLDAGYSVQEIIEEYPDLTREDVEAARRFREGLTRAA
ncbi:DUF433 domain-containing protein [Rhizorhabdus sp. FW153]|uniref:DUF433 domain-containing protein n=1 Tax=Rhizorhabdus sp. FW153 TaxID=3400216 RepID=UPI003CF687C7